MVLIRSKPPHCKRQRYAATFYAILERDRTFLAELFSHPRHACWLDYGRGAGVGRSLGDG